MCDTTPKEEKIIHDVEKTTTDVLHALSKRRSLGGNLFAKIFFSLFIATLAGLVALISIESLSASIQKTRFTGFFYGWIENDRDNVAASAIAVHENHLRNEVLDKEKYTGNLESLEKNIVANQAEEPCPQKITDQSSENKNATKSGENTLTTEIIDVRQIEHEIDFIEAELKRATEELETNNVQAGLKIYESLALRRPVSAAQLYGKIDALNSIATITENKGIFREAVATCFQYLLYDRSYSDDDFKKLSYFCIKSMRNINMFQPAIHIHMLLMKRFDDDPMSRNGLAETYIILKRYTDAKQILEENLKRWPDNGLSLAKYGFILLMNDSSLEEGIHYLRLGINTGDEGTEDQFLYCKLGDTLLNLNRTAEAREVFRNGVAKKLLQNEYQRPLTLIKYLKAQPLWTKEETSYIDIFNLLEANWRQIRDDGISALNENGFFQNEEENLTTIGVWKEFLLVARGEKQKKNCKKAQFTCTLIDFFEAARHCLKGQIKFSVIYPGTHVTPHCGPTNLRLRAHLGLKIPNGTKMRIGDDEISWKEGEFLIFDDSFEHEIWHNGNSTRLVLIIDFWHPQVTDEHKAIIKGQVKYEQPKSCKESNLKIFNS